MKYVKLDSDEQAILDVYDQDAVEQVANLDTERKRYGEYAKNTLNKTKNINIRLSARDIQKLKAKAMEHGMAYQTLVSTILHQYANEKVKITL